jgi:hypothetical protein
VCVCVCVCVCGKVSRECESVRDAVEMTNGAKVAIGELHGCLSDVTCQLLGEFVLPSPASLWSDSLHLSVDVLHVRWHLQLHGVSGEFGRDII